MQHDFQILLVLWGEEFDGSELSSIEDELWDFFWLNIVQPVETDWLEDDFFG